MSSRVFSCWGPSSPSPPNKRKVSRLFPSKQKFSPLRMDLAQDRSLFQQGQSASSGRHRQSAQRPHSARRPDRQGPESWPEQVVDNASKATHKFEFELARAKADSTYFKVTFNEKVHNTALTQVLLPQGPRNHAVDGPGILHRFDIAAHLHRAIGPHHDREYAAARRRRQRPSQCQRRQVSRRRQWQNQRQRSGRTANGHPQRRSGRIHP